MTTTPHFTFPEYLTPAIIEHAVDAALTEDLGGSLDATADITANLIPESYAATATLITRDDMVLCGRAWVERTFLRLDASITLDWNFTDRDAVPKQSTIVTLHGNARAILTAERTALNFLQTLSATATETRRCVDLLGDSKTTLLDTRKTLPLHRLAQKYAVLCGGGANHRIGLYDAFLIKENHIMACGGIGKAIEAARTQAPGKPIEVEVESIDELQQALNAGVDIVMLDNFPLHLIHQAVEITAGRCKLEVSGNITSEELQVLSLAGVDYISSGALTKHVRAIDLSLRLAFN
ncbi:carboxylating nicotinate-nucleotide diphosphorylase [Alteromonas oceanisediminis]|uniref:carboxylating nicotinate-nucleotide diphosphorylase n=1 Tax=Alteromonas oceanisediminis TaxID=2836180 RepID=UPI001BDB4FF8|nr:carboxylating nicotinate-nucleotide diphosphorylase [Alteromonas oceanisediminis]MBT0585543.1 carboxylating nicotinate-nucleotide diphosphorylase [Alteromonas oceanisediminis]